MSVATGYRKELEPSTSSVQLSPQCRHFQFIDILLATENFDESLVIGRGGFGKVYRGTIFNGSATVLAAIKRLDPSSNQGAPEFWAEVEMLSKLRHCNLVSLFGYCNDEEEMILVYEYMPNGTLEDHLHKLGTPLYWLQRLKICIGAGRGLHYLHTGTGIDVGVIHRDIKTSNILLQESWAAKISDFGLSKIGPTNQPSTCVNTLVKGTFGYFDPDYYATGKLTRKSDVYAFGVVLLEVLCRKRAVFDIDEESFNLAIWAQESIKDGNLKNIIDPDLRGQISSKVLKEFVRITKRCLHSSPKQRSTMAEVLFSLESFILNLQEKFNNSVQPAGRTILDRMINMLPFPSNGENTAEEDLEVHLGQLKRFSLHELQVATDNFSKRHILGRGGFGNVYKGRLADGTFVAVKRLNVERTQIGELWFQTEVKMISVAVHRNLLRLRGFCMTPTERLLVYPYMANGDVESCLRGGPGTQKPLDWPIRKRIALGSARGLACLHDHCDPKIIHRDVKAGNILLDKEFEAVVGNFALAKFMDYKETHVTTAVCGTIGHISPEYLSTGKASPKTDVFGYGVMLLELIMGQRAFDLARLANDDDVMMLDWVKGLFREKKLETLVDADLKGKYIDDEVEQLIQVVFLCTQGTPLERPKMSEVVRMLEGDGLAGRWEEWQKKEMFRQEFYNSVQPACRTIHDRMVNMLRFLSNGENTAQGASKPSSEGKSRIGTNTVGADNNTFLDTSELPTDHEARSLKEFEFDDLKKATKKFSPDMRLGEGGFGKVYLGWVDQNTFAPSKQGVGVPVAVKRLSHESMQGYEEWQAEVSFLGRLAHPNIVSLLGYCSNGVELLLVYEYMANKSFDGFLFTNGHNAPNTAEPLSWGTRLMIMIGVARGLTYLHSSQNQIMCRGVKAGDILLDKDFTAKLADFGLAKSSPKIGESHLSTRVMGTYGYADPAYVATGHLCVKSDIYSFGVVLLETLTGLRVLDITLPTERQNLVEWDRPVLGTSEELKEIIDPRLKQNYPLEGAIRCAALALRCLETCPKDRPSSEEVLQSLEEIYAAEE